jgi:hypothetical protein
VRHATIHDVHAAVSWALTHDLPALLAYRQVAHTDRGARPKADAALVAHWQQSTGSARPAVLPGGPLPRRR